MGSPLYPGFHYRPWVASVLTGLFTWILGAIELREPADKITTDKATI